MTSNIGWVTFGNGIFGLGQRRHPSTYFDTHAVVCTTSEHILSATNSRFTWSTDPLNTRKLTVGRQFPSSFKPFIHCYRCRLQKHPWKLRISDFIPNILNSGILKNILISKCANPERIRNQILYYETNTKKSSRRPVRQVILLLRVTQKINYLIYPEIFNREAR